jgi:hypothetical protein
MASRVRVLGGAPGASICLRIFWNRIAFLCRFRVLGGENQGQSHAWKQDVRLKRLGPRVPAVAARHTAPQT